jgi:transcriptional regulator with XRE-family HTH domain
MTQLRTQFAERLKTLRIEKQLTQEQLAKLTGLSTSFISSMERGINAPSFETLESLAKALDVPVKDLFDFDSYGPEIP